MLNCPLCCDQFFLIWGLRLHLRAHPNNGTLDFPIICGLCRESLSTVSIYIRHMRTLHDADVHEEVNNDQDTQFNRVGLGAVMTGEENVEVMDTDSLLQDTQGNFCLEN